MTSWRPFVCLSGLVFAALIFSGAERGWSRSGRADGPPLVQPASFEKNPDIQSASHPHKPHRAFHDVRSPRPPRHRGERPGSAVEDVEDVGSEVAIRDILDIAADDWRGESVIKESAGRLPVGHPLQLLRPPAASVV